MLAEVNLSLAPEVKVQQKEGQMSVRGCFGGVESEELGKCCPGGARGGWSFG